MLRIRLLSGEALADIPLVSDVRGLKRRLNLLHGMPTRFRQRLLLGGSPLDDSTSLDVEMDLELVLLTYCDSSQPAADQLVTAAANGSIPEALLAKPVNCNPNVPTLKP